MAGMIPVVAIHGVSEKKDATGFSRELERSVEALARKHDIKPPRWFEVVWSDLSDLAAGGGLADAADLALDVLRYDRDVTMQAQIMARLRDALARAGECIIVAHSLGSVVACDTLCEDGPGQVRSMITMGSPLALSGAVVDYRSRAQFARAKLSGLEWLDLYSPRDPIATGALGPLQVVDGAQGLESAGYPCESITIDLGMHPIIAHTGYWRNPRVARWILGAASTRG